LMGNKKPQPC